MSLRSRFGPAATTVGGLMVVIAAVVITTLNGLTVQNGLLFVSGGVLMTNGLLGLKRKSRERGERRAAGIDTAPVPKIAATLRERVTAIHALVLIAVLEVAINRVAVPMLGPRAGDPPGWHTALDYAGLFLFYFTGVLAVLVIAQRCYLVLRAGAGGRVAIAHVLAALATLLAAIPLVVGVPSTLSLVLELALAAAVVALVIAAADKDRDLGVQLGLVVICVPLLIHTGNVIGARFVWLESLDSTVLSLARAGVIALSVAALLSPYCFAPRPFSRAVTRPMPVMVAMSLAALGAILGRTYYPVVAKAASLAIGVEMSQGKDPRLALYLLAVATLGWTLASCAGAASEARRQIGLGLACLLLGGYRFHWPHHYLLPLLGVMLVADAARRVRDEELEAMPITAATPPVPDAVWAAYIASVATGLKRTLSDVHTLTTRGEGALVSSIIVGEAAGLPVRMRIERVDGCVLALDVVIGREVDERRAATLTLWAVPLRTLGPNPSGPPAAPAFISGDEAFDERFKTRGSVTAFTQLFDADLRERAATCLDGWVAYWDKEGLRYRVYPGKGSPLDHPLPLSDLFLGRAAQGDRLVAVIELLVAIGSKAVVVPAPAAASSLDDI